MTSTDTEHRPGWYVVMTAAQSEFAAAAGINDLGHTTFAPWKEEERRSGRREYTRKTPTFSRYIFARIAPTDIGVVNECRHVAHVVRFGDVAMPVPDALMAKLLLDARSDQYLDLDSPKPKDPEHDIEPFDWVRFAEGPFQGLLAEVSAVERKEITVWLEMMGSRREIRVQPDNLKKTDAPREKVLRRERDRKKAKRPLTKVAQL